MDGMQQDTESDESTTSESSSASSDPQIEAEGVAATRNRSIWRFKFLYGPHDPILWITLFLAASNAIRTILRGDGSFGLNNAGLAVGPIVVAVELLTPFVVLVLIRYPLAVIIRGVRLSSARPRGPDRSVRAEWLADPARLAEFRLWTKGKWSDQTSGPAPRPRSRALTTFAVLAVVGTVILCLAANVSGRNNSNATAIDPAAKLAVSTAQDKVIASTTAYTEYVKEFGSSSASPATIATKLDAFSASTDAVTAAATAFPESVPADLRSDYIRVGETGSALGQINRSTLKDIRECPDQTCVDRTVTLTKSFRQQALDRWTAALRAIGVPI